MKPATIAQGLYFLTEIEFIYKGKDHTYPIFKTKDPHAYIAHEAKEELENLVKQRIVKTTYDHNSKKIRITILDENKFSHYINEKLYLVRNILTFFLNTHFAVRFEGTTEPWATSVLMPASFQIFDGNLQHIDNNEQKEKITKLDAFATNNSFNTKLAYENLIGGEMPAFYGKVTYCTSGELVNYLKSFVNTFEEYLKNLLKFQIKITNSLDLLISNKIYEDGLSLYFSIDITEIKKDSKKLNKIKEISQFLKDNFQISSNTSSENFNLSFGKDIANLPKFSQYQKANLLSLGFFSSPKQAEGSMKNWALKEPKKVRQALFLRDFAKSMPGDIKNIIVNSMFNDFAKIKKQEPAVEKNTKANCFIM